MSLTDGTGLSATDIMALTGNNDGFGSGFGGGWWVILFILLLCGGWGGNGFGWGNRAGNVGSNYAADTALYAGVQQGFDQSAVMNALNGLNAAINAGFANAAVDSCNKTMTLMQGQNQIQSDVAQLGYNTAMAINNANNGIIQQMTAYEMARQNCCCDAKLQLAQTRADMLAEHCSDRNMINQAMNALDNKIDNAFQTLYAKMDQNRYDDLKAKYDAAIRENERNAVIAGINAQTDALKTNNQYQTDQIMGFLNPPPTRPFYGWQQNQCPCTA